MSQHEGYSYRLIWDYVSPWTGEWTTTSRIAHGDDVPSLLGQHATLARWAAEWGTADEEQRAAVIRCLHAGHDHHNELQPIRKVHLERAAEPAWEPAP